MANEFKENQVKEFIETVDVEGAVLVDFYATWCGPCKMLKPIIEELDKEESMKDVEIHLIDIDEAKELSKELNITSVPTLVLFKDGEIISSRSGYAPKDKIISWVLGELEKKQ